MKQILLVLALIIMFSAPAMAAASYNITAPSDMLEFREAAGDVLRILNSSHLDGLADGSVTTGSGTTTYTQSLRFADTTGSLQAFGVNYAEDTSDTAADFLIIDNDYPFFEWNLSFTSGLSSIAVLEVGSGTAYRLPELEGVKFPILGTNYTVIYAKEQSDELTIHLARTAPIMETLSENATKVYSIDGTYYEVTVIDINTTSNESRLMVEGELADPLSQGERDTLSNGLTILIREVNTTAMTSSFAITGDHLELDDTNYTDANYAPGVEMNNENIDDAEILFIGSNVAATNVTIDTISYRLTANPAYGSTLYIAEGYGVREYLDEQEALLGVDFDIRYEGLGSQTWSDMTLTPAADDETYLFTFTNVNDEEYTFPLLTNSSGVFKFGNETSDLVFWEAMNATTPNIGVGDFIVLNYWTWLPTSQTCIVRYDGASNTSLIANFTYVNNGTAVSEPYANLSAAANGTLSCDGNTFDFYVENGNTTGTHRIAMDQNSNGSVGSALIGITVKGGGRFSLLNAATGTYDYAIFINSSGSQTNISAHNAVGDGRNISTATGWSNGAGTGVLMKLITDAALFESPSAGEQLNLTIDSVSGGVNISSIDYYGQTSAGSSEKYNIFELVADETGDTSRTYTDYGVMIAINEPAGASANLTIRYPASQLNATVMIELPMSTEVNNTAWIGPYIEENLENVSVTDDSFGFDANFSADTANVTYTISNGPHTWSNASWNSTQLTTASFRLTRSFDALYLPAGDWTLNITATNSTGGSRTVTSSVESNISMEKTIISAASASTSIGGDDVSFTFNITVKSAGSKVAAYLALSSGSNTFNARYATLNNGTHSVNVSGSADYSGAVNVTIPGINSTPSYVTMNISDSIRNTQVVLTLQPYASLIAGTYTGSYGFGVFG